jgi:hypothetical protein
MSTSTRDQGAKKHRSAFAIGDTIAVSLDHLVGADHDGWRNGDAERFGGLELDDHLKLVDCSTGRSAGRAPFKILST